MTIFHFVGQREWDKARGSKCYEPDSLKSEGFIHCCTRIQISGLARRLCEDQPNILLLEMDEALVKKRVIHEDLYGNNQLFPHIYGELNLDAVIGVYTVESAEGDQVTLTPCIDLL
ncbi:DUF952 domain-containing protein [Paenibacillus sp. PR3]|uniref:DUF952 domain-containing protein n=1 Tax=Paenibacillus terricola TaxID=2763503 RepID=A0ABR8MV60_9BACL|nr:DUF952 domain-containing protein [Paenibacillus terricola]MBD3918892.1 DUF952 domain-containing protein [Paenibacillus terricola]